MEIFKMDTNIQIYFTGLLTLLVLFLLMFRVYRKYVAPFRAFPTSFLTFKYFRNFILGKKPKNMTHKSYFLGIFISELKKYVSAGFCVVWAPKPHLLVFNEEAVRILNNDQAALDKAEAYFVLHDTCKNGLLTSCTELWRKRRKMFQPGFQVSVLKNYTLEFNKNAAILIERLRKVTNEAEDVIHSLKICALDNLLGTVFGMDVTDPSLQAGRDKMIEASETFQTMFVDRASNPLILDCLLPLIPYGRKYLKARGQFLAETRKVAEEMIETVLKRQKEKPTSEEDDCLGALHKSFAELAVEYHMQDSSFTLEHVVEEVATLTIAGFDTVAYTVMWCLFMLCNHPEVQDRVYDELKHLKGKDITYTDILSMHYTDAVVKETMRLYPTLPLYGRSLRKHIQCGKFTIPKGTNIIFFLYLLHRDPDVYPNPDKFDPERFKQNTSKNPWSYIPFAEGVRSCIGKKFALNQVKVTLAHILLNFKVTSPQRVDDVHVGWEIVLSASPPVLMRFTPRNHTLKQE